jgi:hypothetical protein
VRYILITTIVLVIALFACQGPEGAPGASGERGPIGSPGPKGSDGSQGIPGTSIGIVELCPGSTTYPSTFIEVAFCINGVLYGTYSANGGFSTELPPGTYNSNGINSTCTFTILPGCVIQ